MFTAIERRPRPSSHIILASGGRVVPEGMRSNTDHPIAHIGQHHGGEWPLSDTGQLDHGYTCEMHIAHARVPFDVK
jgi:hypothetical protein